MEGYAMKIELTVKETKDLEGLISLVLDQYVPDDFPDNLDSLEYRQGRISQALLAAGEVERAMQYLGPIDPAHCEDIYLLEAIAAAYIQCGQYEGAVPWEDRAFQLANEQPDFFEAGHFNHLKHATLCNLAKLAHERGDRLRMERGLNAIQYEHHYHCNEGLHMIDQLAECGAYAQLRIILRYLTPLHITLSYSWSGTPVVETLLRHGLELEFWALAGMMKDVRLEEPNTLLHCGIGRAVALDQIPLAFRIMSLEASGETALLDELCNALAKSGKEAELKTLLADGFKYHRLSAQKYLRALSTYARGAWNTDREFILEFVMCFWNREGGLDSEMQSQIVSIFAWLNHWDGPFTLDYLRAIKDLKWRPLVAPALLHGNQELLDMIFEIVEPKQQVLCYLLTELEKFRLGQSNDIGAGIREVLANWEAYDKPWTWGMLKPLYDFSRRELRDVDSMASVMEFAKRRAVIPERLCMRWYAEALAKAGRIAEALPYIAAIESHNERIELVARCIRYFFAFKRGVAIT